ncbi:FG-GAP repeat domain-containing protein [Streptomyces fuscigenes]|uniref:FG-GAP repeat domain-containing protein n=1 Tax=Streptomyces fuscigenes TaxID=1528880 RepID=UPI001F2EB1F5|nr:VCBS repeat-containing protein [Streptomyces fuscigenes]MCF3963024.1 FG-GAP-like repeat-containing protein [Streptomyces fuscigenes]
MSHSSPARIRPRRSGRLIAVCTSGILAAGAFALGPAGVAQADTGSGTAPHAIAPVAPKGGQQPTLSLPKKAATHAKGARSLARSAARAPLTTPRFDPNNDGVADALVEGGNGSLGEVNVTAGTTASHGTVKVKYQDILTPGHESSAATQVLSLTTTGKLSLWNYASFPGGSPLWTGSGWNTYNKVVAVGDTNGDGFGDLLARTHTGDLYLYKGTGKATSPFTAKVKVGSGFGGYDQLLGAGDITGTGYESLVARDLNGDLWYFRLDGTAAAPLAARVKIGTGWNTYNQVIGYGDDETQQGGILGRKVGGDVYYYTGRPGGSGTSSLTAKELFGTGWNSELFVGQGKNLLWGKNNLFGLTSGGDIYYYSGLNTGSVTARELVGSGFKGAKLIAPVSLTSTEEQPLLELYQGTLYNDTPGFEGVKTTGFGSYNLVVGPGDLNGDGNSDLIARDSGGTLWLYTGKGDGHFNAKTKIGTGWNQFNQLVGAGDINGDGYADIVARNSAGQLYFYAGKGSAASPFQAKSLIGPGWNMFTKLAAPGDLDGDGRADLVAVTSGGQLYRYSSTGHTGTSTFKARVEIGKAGWNGYTSLL